MSNIKSHRDLVVWQKAMELAEYVYRISEQFPPKEMYGLRAQLTRAIVSVPGNIAEGSARGTLKEYSRFLAISKGSLMEAETYIDLAVRLKFISEEDAHPAFGLIVQVSKMITTMRTKLDS